ncbi:MAG: hypothetical protein J0H29_02880 [Sphingobacteriales bacterium]|nr:hypothetical protein [Sphingobacteriales bacterium]OJY85605.1 MAG: hypothetical protein BGP14_00195 [Sphingobacteriales bacterium 44-15]
MKVVRLIPVLMALFFASCGKEASVEKKEAPEDSTENKDGLLTRFVTKYNGGSDSLVYTFQYDNNKRLKIFNMSGPDNDHKYIIEQSYRYYRNASGLVERYVEYATAVINNIRYEDSAVYHLHLNGGKYDYAIREVLDLPGPVIKDSVIYGYDANGRIINVHALRYEGSAWTEFQKALYNYDVKGNITQVTLTFDDPDDPPQVITAQYSDKSAAADFGNEILLNGLFAPELCGPNSLLGLDNPEGPDKYSFSYEYNSSGKPVKGTQTDLLNGGTAQLYYYYQ